MSEPVRLVIWDLDETFWSGTLTEGGIKLRSDTIEIVKELARRGIVSSICSKNDFNQVRDVLQSADVWDYFVLPSINWEPKGVRVASIIETIQLRPPTVMFIDDNPINREEVRRLIPEIQIRSEKFIGEILADPLFVGKDDAGLRRLQQYRLLEKRKADEIAASGDITDFLRSSHIRVRFDYDVLGNLDRAVELINRTNQLNFTKQRLPEDIAKARADLRDLISSHEVRVALVGVRDNYGDHGWCGIYVLKNGQLLHFAFSCRILGMQVETWLYDRLGRPRLEIRGEVLTDMKRAATSIDWIQIEDVHAKDNEPSQVLLKRLVARGGCDLMPVAHYFGLIAEEVVGEFNDNRIGMDGRVDHSVFLRTALTGGLSPAALRAAERLGYRKSDFESAATHPPKPPEIWILSFWSDAAYVLYKHKEYGFEVPFSLTGYHDKDAREASVERLRTEGVGEPILGALATLQSDYHFTGFISEAEFKDNIRTILSSASPEIEMFVVGANEYFIDSSGVGEIMKLTRQQNRWISEIASSYKNVMMLNIRDYVRSEDEIHSPYHFDRIVYYRLFESVKSQLAEARAANREANAGWAVHTRSDLYAALMTPLSADTLSRTAKFLMADGKIEYAVRFASKAVDLEPNSVTHRLVYLEAVVESRDPAQLAAARVMIEQDVPLPASVLHRLGDVLVENGDLEGAVTAFRQAADVEPNLFHHRHRLANVLERLGRPEETYRVLQECLDNGDVNPHVMAHVARLLIDFRRFGEARGLLQDALARHSDFPPLNAALFSLDAAERALEGADIATTRSG